MIDTEYHHNYLQAELEKRSLKRLANRTFRLRHLLAPLIKPVGSLVTGYHSTPEPVPDILHNRRVIVGLRWNCTWRVHLQVELTGWSPVYQIYQETVPGEILVQSVRQQICLPDIVAELIGDITKQLAEPAVAAAWLALAETPAQS